MEVNAEFKILHLLPCRGRPRNLNKIILTLYKIVRSILCPLNTFSLGKCFKKIVNMLKPNVANILLFNFCEQKFVQYGPITIAINCNGLFLFIFEEKWPNDDSGPKSAPNNDSLWMRRLFNVCVRVFCAQMRSFFLFTYPPKSK